MSNEYPVLYAGKISFMNQGGVDIGALEAHSSSLNFLRGIEVEKNLYHCHYALSNDGKRVNAIMVVSRDYEGDVLEADELYGSFSVGLSGVVGFFSSPKKEYTMKQMYEYSKQIDREHSGKSWYILNTKQFMVPSSQVPATDVNVYVHRNESKQIDAIQMEFNRKQNDIIMEAVNNG